MRWSAAVVAFVLLSAATPAIGSFHETPVGVIPDRVHLLAMSGTSFNGLHAPDAPLLEAYLGENVRFILLATEPHTFHLHGHPWLLEDGSVVDTFLSDVDTPHVFDVPAGGVDQHAGDWMYHCHINAHVASGMWGIFRVYPFTTTLLGVGPSMVVTLDRLGEPLQGAALSVSVDGVELPAHVEPLGHGAYRVHSALPATGELVVTATHPAHGTSLARAGLGGEPLPLPTIVASHHDA